MRGRGTRTDDDEETEVSSNRRHSISWAGNRINQLGTIKIFKCNDCINKFTIHSPDWNPHIRTAEECV